MRVSYCKCCVTPTTRPRISFNADGICNACLNADAKQSIDWSARRREFVEFIDRHRARDGHYDCIVPWSGGKDSSTIAHRLKTEFGLNPLLVTFSPLIPNEVGRHNREELLKCGFDHLMIRPNQKVARQLARRFFIERGNPKVAWDAGVTAVPVRIAVQLNIPLVFYAEHGESEYGGHVLSEEHKKIRDLSEVLEHLVGDDPCNWTGNGIEDRDLAQYQWPDVDSVDRLGVKVVYFSYFFRWSVHENYLYIKDKIDFHVADKGRSCGTFTNYDSLDDKIDALYYYMQLIKFGFGRTVRDASRMIQQGRLDRAQALDLVSRYDTEFPADHLDEVLDYLGLDEQHFTAIVDRHRLPDLWTFRGNQWELRHPPR